MRDIQQELTDKGYDLGKVDGVWGNKSINALRKFQKDHGSCPGTWCRWREVAKPSSRALFIAL
ncbi:peptidoglycan-binding domain-containing protein [Rhizobium rhizogenes]|uniref:peptidoglycan-binding domain-containing protein n=1 Tax=Rhizobium rhizogenes TaxID=359 RepID=UPI0015718642|nr:peptidoglycan-binding protein [Rhizobium rhizogenes]